VIAPILPHISNHTDFDPLRRLEGIDFRFVPISEAIPPADVIILAGSKNTRGDLAWLQSSGWVDAIKRHVRFGGKVIGICGGYQMLGLTIADPEGLEGEAGVSGGLGLLPIETVLAAVKQLRNVSGILTLNGDSVPIEGYEIHHGLTHINDNIHNTLPSLLTFDDGRHDGMMSADQQVIGCYLHGLFDKPDALNLFLTWAGCHQLATQSNQEVLESEINRLADTLDVALDWQKVRTAGLVLP
jgi:adenosylcobyric acid synthase